MVVLFDFDEVFVDLNSGALKYINSKLGTNYALKDVTSWDFYNQMEIREPFMEYLALPNLYQDHVGVNKSMIKVLKQMVDMGKEVYIVTASVECTVDSKYKFIKEQMGFFDTKNLFTINATSKYKQKSDVLEELKLNYHEPIVLIDDGIHNILDMMADIKHKEHLDGIMRSLYKSRTLQKYNNPYHEFIYGIVPELPYNEKIVDGKRIFKLKQTKDIWGLLDKIKSEHKIRIDNKQFEVFNFLNNIVNEQLPEERFKYISDLQNNVSFLIKTVLNKENVHSNFLTDIARFSVKVEEFVKAHSLSMNIDGARIDEVNRSISVVFDLLFKSADKKFGSDVMYNEVKSLVALHVSPEALPSLSKTGLLVSETYKISESQQDFLNASILSTLIEISKENLVAGKRIVSLLDSEEGRTKIAAFLSKTGADYDVDFSDELSLISNAILAFNKNYKFEKETGILKTKDLFVEEFRRSLLNLNDLSVRVANKIKL